MQWGKILGPVFLWLGGILCGSMVFSQDSEPEVLDNGGQTESGIGAKKQLVIARPDASGIPNSGEANWIAAFSEEYLNFRLGAVGQISVISSDSLAAFLSAGSGAGYGRDYSQSQYSDAAKRMDATHVLFIRFQQGSGKKSIKLSSTLLSVRDDNSVSFSVDGTTETLHETLNAGILQILRDGGIPLNPRERKFFGIDILAGGSNAKAVGTILAEARNASGKEHQKIADNLKSLTKGSAPCLLAFYAGAREYAKASRFEDAAHLLRDLTMKLGPNHPLLYTLAARYFRLGDNNEDALQMINIAQGMKLATDDLLIEKAMVYEGLEEWKKAEAAYQEVLKLDPSNFRGLLFFMKKYNKENRFSEALEMAERFVPLYPNCGAGHLEMGKSQIALDRYSEAMSSLEKAGSILIKDGAIQLMLGDLYARDGDLTRAVGHYSSAMQLMPENADPFVKAARIHNAQENPRAALDVLTPKEKQFYDNPHAQKEMGMARYRTGDFAGAKRNLRRCLESGAQDAEVLFALGEIYERDGEFRQSLDMYTRVRVLDPKNTDAANRIAALKGKAAAEEESAAKEAQEDAKPVKHGPVLSKRMTIRIIGGALSLGSIAGGYFMDMQVKKNLDLYKNSKKVTEVNDLHATIEQYGLYRNCLYAAGAVFAAGIGVTFFF